MIGVNPNLQCHRFARLARLHGDAGFVQFQGLTERQPGGKRIGFDGHAHPAQLPQHVIAVEGIGFADVEQQVATLFAPDVQADVAIAQRH